MTDKEIARLVSECIKESERSARGKTFILKPDTIIKAEKISRNINCDCRIEFDSAFNAVDIILKGFVFDSQTSCIKNAFALADVFMIDSDADGRVNIELRLLNAAVEA